MQRLLRRYGCVFRVFAESAGGLEAQFSRWSYGVLCAISLGSLDKLCAAQLKTNSQSWAGNKSESQRRDPATDHGHHEKRTANFCLPNQDPLSGQQKEAAFCHEVLESLMLLHYPKMSASPTADFAFFPPRGTGIL